MHGKFIQISAVLTPAGVALYALDDNGKVYEKLVGMKNATWVLITG